jgi:alpha-1,2-mannosyltransferase
MFISSTSFLPSSFSMYFIMISIGFWLKIDTTREKWKFIILFCGISIIIGWPFCIICILPIVLHSLYDFNIKNVLKFSIFTIFIILFPMILIDSYYYNKITVTTLNLVLYNKGSGSELYGVEPWSFYLKNLFLNFNFILIFSFLAPFSLLLTSNFKKILFILPYFIWFIFFTIIPHKEERFMFVIYPLLCLAVIININSGFNWVSNIIKSGFKNI